MNTIIAIALTVLGVFGVIYSYSNIRRGGARVYTLERETILRRATSALGLSTLFFIGAVGALYFEQTQLVALLEEADAADPAAINNPSQTDIPVVQPEPTDAGAAFIPALATAEPEPTIDPNIPTPTPTIAVVRGFISDTGGFGVNFREAPDPNAELIEILPEDTFVTVLEEEGAIESAGFIWLKIRTFTGAEGWIVEDFITIEGR